MAFTIIREDLARVQADAIVVPANKYLTMTGGTGLAVAKAAGYRRLTRACKRLGGCPVGQAVATPAYRLKADHIIHAVGPIWRDGAHDEPRLLRSAYDNALQLALRLNAQSVALPLLSAGTFGYPIHQAFEVAVDAIRAFLETADMDVILVLYDKRAVTEGSRMFGEIAEYIDDAYTESYARPNMSHRRWVEEGLTLAADSVPSGFDAAEEADADFGPGDTGLLYLDAAEAPMADGAPQAEFAQRISEKASGQAGYCSHCGASYEPGAVFCMQCGYPLDGRPVSTEEALHLEELSAIPNPWVAGEAASSAPSYSMSAPQMAPEPTAASPAPKASGRPHLSAPTALPKGKSGREPSVGAAPTLTAERPPSLGDMLAHMDAPFSMMLMQLIDARGLTDAQVYKRANITRQHFSKMRNPGYRPTKKTVVALAVALELPLEDMRELLARAGFALSHSDKFDIIVEYFVSHGNYDMFTINEALFAYDQPLLN